MPDELERAEEIARKLAKTSSDFVYLSPGDRAVLMVMMDQHRELSRRVEELERKASSGTYDR